MKARTKIKPQKSAPKKLELALALRSFRGYLVGSGKALNTLESYDSDLVSFQEFLETGLSATRVSLSKITLHDVEQYHDWLKLRGLKSNTRRRKILTLRRLLSHLTQRKKISIDIGRKLPAPEKIEKPPFTVSTVTLLRSIHALPTATETSPTSGRNRILLWVLAETGCQVSEVCRLKIENFDPAGFVLLTGKSERVVPVSKGLGAAVLAIKTTSAWLFTGHNKFGSLGSPISSRGVEMIVRDYSKRLGLGEMTPRTFRHSAVLHWHQEGLDKAAIQKRLGLKTDYAFRIYEPLFTTKQPTTKQPSNPTAKPHPPGK